MIRKKKTDLKKVVKKAQSDKEIDEEKAIKDAKPTKDSIPDLEEHGVEPVVGTKDKGKKPKGAAKNVGKKSKKKPPGKTDTGAIKEGEEKPPVGEKTKVATPDRERKRGFFDWWLDGGKPS